MIPEEKSLEEKTDYLLDRVEKSDHSVAIVVAFALAFYFLGYYIGDIVHYLGGH